MDASLICGIILEMMRGKLLKFLFMTAFLLGSPLALAQTAKTEAPKPRINVLPPAYDNQMMRLAEILGALHYLRELCGSNEKQLWREKMTFLIANEEPTDERKARLISNFNKGFRGFREIYRECTPTAVTAANRYLKQGARLSAEIPDRYGR
ncbi:MAG: TIGR02301 family protein [Rhizobiaceae bacterium]